MLNKISHKIRNRLLSSYRDILINRIAASVLMPRHIRFFIYRLYGMSISTANISPGIFFGGNNVTIGPGTFINYKCFFDTQTDIKIGANCDIAMEVMFCTSTHEFGTKHRRAGRVYGLPIGIGNGCWIGTRAVILPGVTVGDGCIIAAGSVVTKDCEPHGVYAGIPAKRIKELV